MTLSYSLVPRPSHGSVTYSMQEVVLFPGPTQLSVACSTEKLFRSCVGRAWEQGYVGTGQQESLETRLAIVQTAIVAKVLLAFIHFSLNTSKERAEFLEHRSARQTWDTCLQWGLEEVSFSSSRALVPPLLCLHFQYHQLWHVHRLLVCINWVQNTHNT